MTFLIFRYKQPSISYLCCNTALAPEIQIVYSIDPLTFGAAARGRVGIYFYHATEGQPRVFPNYFKIPGYTLYMVGGIYDLARYSLYPNKANES